MMSRDVRYVTGDRRTGDAPVNEDDLVPLSAIVRLVLEIVDGPSALGFWELGDELVIGARLGRLVDDNLGFGVVDLEDDVLDLLAQLELLELVQARRGDADARRLQQIARSSAIQMLVYAQPQGSSQSTHHSVVAGGWGRE